MSQLNPITPSPGINNLARNQFPYFALAKMGAGECWVALVRLMEIASSPSLPFPAALAAILGSLGLVLVVCLRAREPALRFVVLALWTRYALSAFPHFTYPPMIAGFSLNALASLGVIGLGVVVVSPRAWRLRALAPFYAFLAALVLSLSVNADVARGVDALLKWAYFVVIVVSARQAALRVGPDRFAGYLAAAFSAPLALQLISVGLGVSKLADEDGSRSFIGGYNHEAAFSVILLTAFLVAVSARSWPAIARVGFASLCLVGLLLASYRTTLIAAAPLAAVFLVTEVTGWFRRSDRMAVGALVALVAIGGLGLASIGLGSRLAELANATAGLEALQRAPEEFTRTEQDYFSARFYLWSQYLDAVERSGPVQQLVGHGPEAWRGQFATYAHNTLVSTLYELGWVGLTALLGLLASMLLLSLRARPVETRAPLFAAHLAVFLLNMATMGFWLVEGLILYALVCALTIARAAPLVASPARPAVGARFGWRHP